MTPEQEQALLAATALGLDDRLREGLALLIQLILEKGMTPRDATDKVLKTFAGEFYSILADGFSAIMEKSISTQVVKDYPVSGVKLSQRLYSESRRTSAVVSDLVKRHAKGFQQSRDLAMQIYEGYGFKPEEAINLNKRNPKLPKYLREVLLTDPTIANEYQRLVAQIQAGKLKTPALRAAYMEALKELEKGAGEAALKKKMDVAFHERMRYFSNRIAQTELRRASMDMNAREIMEDDDIHWVRFRLSAAHPATDICDLYAKQDKYGKGQGVYPKALAPRPPIHPHCHCGIFSIITMDKDTITENHDSERAFLQDMDIADAARVVGSRAKLQRVLDGDDLTGILNAGKDPMYHVKTVGGG